MANTLRTTREDVAEQASSIAENLQGAGEAARRMATENIEALRETASDYMDQGRARARELGATVQHRVQEQPMAAVLIATAVGFLLGVLWVRR